MTHGVLAVVSHPDDETFGCGGTLAKHVSAGHSVDVLCLTCNPRSRRSEIEAAADVLGVKLTLFEDDHILSDAGLIRRVSDIINEVKPRIVISHHGFDYHREHKACYSVVKEAIEWAAHTTMYKDAWCVERFLLMEVNTLIPSPQIIVDITGFFETKQRAVQQYTSQLAKFPWGYYEKLSLKKAELRGVQGNVEYGEAFIEETLPRNAPFYAEKHTDLLL